MAIQMSVLARDGRLNAFETETGTDARLKLRTGAQPANCAAADSGTVLCTMILPSDWLAVAGSGTKAKAGTWSGTGSGGGGVVAHFRIYKSDGTTCTMQGTVGQGSGDMSLDNTTVADSQVITVTSFVLTDGNA